MNLSEMRAIVRRDLHDEDETSYRWSDDELDRHIGRAVKELSIAIPDEQKAARATTAGSREIDISDLSQRITVLAVEYPVDKLPQRFQRFSLWADTLNLLGEEVPDGSNVYIYYGKLHSLDGTGSTIPPTWRMLSPAAVPVTPPPNGPSSPSTGSISAAAARRRPTPNGGGRGCGSLSRNLSGWDAGTGFA